MELSRHRGRRHAGHARRSRDACRHGNGGNAVLATRPSCVFCDVDRDDGGDDAALGRAPHSTNTRSISPPRRPSHAPEQHLISQRLFAGLDDIQPGCCFRANCASSCRTSLPGHGGPVGRVDRNHSHYCRRLSMVAHQKRMSRPLPIPSKFSEPTLERRSLRSGSHGLFSRTVLRGLLLGINGAAV